MRLVTAEEMRLADEAAINEYGIPGLLLMENAGQAVVRQAEKMLGTLSGKKAAIFCGGGNNGGASRQNRLSRREQRLFRRSGNRRTCAGFLPIHRR